jgi:ribosome-binding protein aMBF1 (putative translation factor)
MKLQKARMLMLFYLKRHSKIDYIMAQEGLAKKIYCKKTIIFYIRTKTLMDNQKILKNIHVELMIVHQNHLNKKWINCQLMNC